MLVIIEKLAVVDSLDSALREAYPSETLEYLVANAHGMPFVFDYPRNLRWDEYPYAQPARYKRVADSQFGAQVQMVEGGLRKRRYPVDYASLAKGQTAISCTDANSSDVAAATRLRKYLELRGVINKWGGSFVFLGLSKRDIQTSLGNPLSEHDEALACARAALKADFEYSFLVNSAGLLTRCYHAAGGEFVNPVFSKYTVQMLYALRADFQAGLCTRAESLVHRFQNWKGTGRYAEQRAQLGSCSSQMELLDTLQRYGLIDCSSEQPELQGNGAALQTRSLRPTALAESFLAKLHPDCEDRDLPFRLAGWQDDPCSQHRVASQRYLRSWFGRQKTFMERAAR